MSREVEKLEIPGPAGALEALLQLPDGEPRGIAIVCHPHPLYEGTMHNKVAYMLARALCDQGLVALRFNFRGVGASAGEYAAAVGETEDALAALDWLAARYPGLPQWVAGFSFGAFVAFQVAQRREPAQLITVAPPVERFAFGTVAPACPWLLLIGDADEVVDCPQVLAWAEALEPAPQIIVMPGAGHFMHGNLTRLREFVRKLPPPSLG